MFQNLQKKVSEIAKEEASKESIKKRLSWNAITEAAKKVRNVSGTLSLLCLSVSQMPVKLPENVKDWSGWAAAFFGIIAGGAYLNKGDK